MFREITGLSGRLLRGYDVLTEFAGWTASAYYSGAQDAADRRPGGVLSVKAHRPDELYWPPAESARLQVELDLGRAAYVAPARVMTVTPLTVEILGPLDPQ